MELTKGWLVAGRVVMSAAALVIFAGLPAVLATGPAGTRTALALGAAAFTVTWLWFWWRAVDSTGAATLLTLALMTALLAGLTYLAPPGRDGLILAALASGAGLRPRPALAAIIGISVLAGAIQAIHGTPALQAGGAVVNDLVAGVASIGGRLLLETNRELAQARDEVARLAVGEERLRFARDLHDLLGQDLTLTVMKSDLVARGLPADTPRDVRQLQAEISAGIRQALDNMRAAVGGYRARNLDAEIVAARAALRVVGIDMTLAGELGPLPPEQVGALSWALRESITNVVRHSGARRCDVRMRREDEHAVLEVEDDGRPTSPRGDGTGLAGIAERLKPFGGTVDTGPMPKGGHRLRVSLPLTQP